MLYVLSDLLETYTTSRKHFLTLSFNRNKFEVPKE